MTIFGFVHLEVGFQDFQESIFATVDAADGLMEKEEIINFFVGDGDVVIFGELFGVSVVFGEGESSTFIFGGDGNGVGVGDLVVEGFFGTFIEH